MADSGSTEASGSSTKSPGIRIKSSDTSESSIKSPGIGMKMSISMISTKFNKVKNVSTDTLDKWMKDQQRDIVLLDCRPKEEFVVSHIQGSIRVEYEDTADKILQELPTPKDDKLSRTVVCYCSAGYRSSMVADKVQEYYKKTGSICPFEVFNLEGSLFKWANEGRPMININNKTTTYAHPYNTVFGKLLDSKLRRDKLEDTTEGNPVLTIEKKGK